MSFIRVMSGKFSANSDVMNSTTGTAEKIGKLYSLCGKKQSVSLGIKAAKNRGWVGFSEDGRVSYTGK